jgi:signal-transduction protein with cAMP-binding, CBS, and nucleotidyltransferase domain
MLADVINRLIEKQVHRLWIVDDHCKPVGVVSMTDICKLIRDHVDASWQHQARTTRDSLCRTFLSHEGTALCINGEHVRQSSAYCCLCEISYS